MEAARRIDAAERQATAPWPALVMPVLLVAVTVACFFPVVRNGFVNWDDDVNFLDNTAYRGLSPSHIRWALTTFQGGHYQPLAWLSFEVDYTLWGMNPAGYHLTSLALHVLTVLLVWALVQALLRAANVSAASAAAAFGALVFAVHPLRVESVAWLTERNGVLAVAFLVVAVLAYLRRHEAERAGRSGRAWYVASIACFAVSLVCKATGIALPAVLLVLDVYPLRRLDGSARSRRAALLDKVPYAALALGAVVLSSVEVRLAPATRSLAQHGVVERLAQAAYGLCFYLGKTVLPVGLSPLYLLERTLDPTRPRYVLAVLAVIAITAALIRVRRRWPWALTAWACYVLLALPVLGLVQRGEQITADRYTYLACLPWAVLAAAAFAASARRHVTASLAVASVVIGVLGVSTFRQIAVWHDSYTLWEQALRIDPDNYLAHINHGWARHVDGDLMGAITDYGQALHIDAHAALAYNDRGYAYQELGALERAVTDYSNAIRVNSSFGGAYYNRGTARQALGDRDGAIADYDAAIRLDPEDARPFNNRGTLRQTKGDVDGAIADWSEAIRLDPSLHLAWYNRGRAYQQRGDLLDALGDYTRTLETAPHDWSQRPTVERQLTEVRRALRERSAGP